jgi:YHS domain-containing protein
MRTLRFLYLGVLVFLLALLSACGTPYATQRTRAGQDVMLLGHDPVMYFSAGKSMRGNPAIQSTLPGRTYYFSSAANKASFDAAPDKFEPQYGGFCSSGAAYGIKLGSDPTEWRIVNGKLYMFGDVMGRYAWELDPAWNIERGDQMWPEAKDAGWRSQSLQRYASKVPWYKTGADIRKEFAQKHPGREWPQFDVGGMFSNLFLKEPGWRAREGFGGQPVVGLVVDDVCPPACAGTESQSFPDPLKASK